MSDVIPRLTMVSFFLRLPREIRDQIIQLALYNDGGVVYRSHRNGISRLYRTHSTPSSFRKSLLDEINERFPRMMSGERRRCSKENNQLKYVCRQLYWETKDKELHLNVIVFDFQIARRFSHFAQAPVV